MLVMPMHGRQAGHLDGSPHCCLRGTVFGRFTKAGYELSDSNVAKPLAALASVDVDDETLHILLRVRAALLELIPSRISLILEACAVCSAGIRGGVCSSGSGGVGSREILDLFDWRKGHFASVPFRCSGDLAHRQAATETLPLL